MRQKTRQALCYQGVLSHFKDQEIGVYFESSLFSVAVLAAERGENWTMGCEGCRWQSGWHEGFDAREQHSALLGSWGGGHRGVELWGERGVGQALGFYGGYCIRPFPSLFRKSRFGLP